MYLEAGSQRPSPLASLRRLFSNHSARRGLSFLGSLWKEIPLLRVSRVSRVQQPAAEQCRGISVLPSRRRSRRRSCAGCGGLESAAV